jgi:hypothetical protein
MSTIPVSSGPSATKTVPSGLQSRSPPRSGTLSTSATPTRLGAGPLGAITTLGVTFNSCCHDPRVDAAVEIRWRPPQLLYGDPCALVDETVIAFLDRYLDGDPEPLDHIPGRVRRSGLASFDSHTS